VKKKELNEYLEPGLQDRIVVALKQLQNVCNAVAGDKGFWDKDRALIVGTDGGTPTDLNLHALKLIQSTKISLVVTELAEAIEGLRAGNPPSDKLHEFGICQAEEELADAVIRIFDLAGEYQWDLPRTILKKLQYNTQRERLHGKKF